MSDNMKFETKLMKKKIVMEFEKHSDAELMFDLIKALLNQTIFNRTEVKT